MNGSRIERLSNLLLAVVFLAMAYGIGRLIATVDLTPVPWIIVLVVATFAAALLFLSMFVTYPAKLNVALLAVSLMFSFAAGNVALKLSGRKLIDIFDAKIVRRFAVAARPADVLPAVAASAVPDWESTRPPDPRPVLEIQKALQDIGYTFSPSFNPHSLMPLIDAKIFPQLYPLGSPSSSFGITVGCSEGDQREYPVYRKDRYGFNNDDTIYAFKNPFMVVGGSFASGSCVHQDETLQGVLRRNGYPTFSMGFGASGAVAALASLKEYGETYRPKAVLWQFYDPNDIEIVRRELHSPFLLQYLRDGFTQDLIHRQSDVDVLWRSIWDSYPAVLDKWTKDPEQQAIWESRVDTNLPMVQELLGRDIASLRDDSDVLKIYERILALAKRRVEAWGGRVYVVMIPNMDIYTQGTIPKYQRSVASALSSLGIRTIDVDLAIRSAGDPLPFFANPHGWSHFNARGYRLMARQIAAALDADFPPPQPQSTAAGAALPQHH